MMLIDEVHRTGNVKSPEQAREWMDTVQVQVEHRDELAPHDKDKEIDRDVALVQAGLKDPLDVVEKYNSLGGGTKEAKWTAILANCKKLREELPPVSSATAKGGQDARQTAR
jgi:hypothetical protein